MAKKTPQPEAAEFQVDLDADEWASDEAGPSSLASRLVAEFLGTFALMFVGLGAILFGSVLSQNTASGVTNALAWAVALAALIVAVGRVSGAHFNPAVTVGAWAAGRFPGRDVALYVLVQAAGALLAAGALTWLTNGFPLFSDPASGDIGPGDAMAVISIGAGEHSPGGVDLPYGIVVEVIATALFVAVVLAATSVKAPKGQAPFVIGFSLAILIFIATPFTNGSVNPVRATATAVFADTNAGNWAIGQLYWWWLTAIIAGAFVGLLFRAFGPVEDLETIEVIEVIED